MGCGHNLLRLAQSCWVACQVLLSRAHRARTIPLSALLNTPHHPPQRAAATSLPVQCRSHRLLRRGYVPRPARL